MLRGFFGFFLWLSTFPIMIQISNYDFFKTLWSETKKLFLIFQTFSLFLNFLKTFETNNLNLSSWQFDLIMTFIKNVRNKNVEIFAYRIFQKKRRHCEAQSRHAWLNTNDHQVIFKMVEKRNKKLLVAN